MRDTSKYVVLATLRHDRLLWDAKSNYPTANYWRWYLANRLKNDWRDLRIPPYERLRGRSRKNVYSNSKPYSVWTMVLRGKGVREEGSVGLCLYPEHNLSQRICLMVLKIAILHPKAYRISRIVQDRLAERRVEYCQIHLFVYLYNDLLFTPSTCVGLRMHYTSSLGTGSKGSLVSTGSENYTSPGRLSTGSFSILWMPRQFYSTSTAT